MKADRRPVLPWVLYGGILVLLAVTLSLTFLNDSFESFIVVAVMMIVGYGTVGALLALRVRGNVLGWLMITIAFGFVLTGLTEELLTYAYKTNPGADVPFLGAAAWVTNWAFFAMAAPIPLLLLLFPTGRVHSPRWRFLPPAVASLGAIGVVATILKPGLVDLEVARIQNPTGISGLGGVAGAVLAVVAVGFLVATPSAVVALFLRFRRASSDERQQIRWLAYLALLACLLLVGMVISGVVAGSDGQSALDDFFWFSLFACVGVAFPIAVGVAIFKYRLYDLDLVIKKTVLYSTVAVLLTGAFFIMASLASGRVIEANPRTVVALLGLGFAIWPAVRLARRVADQVVYGRRATPYEVLSEFSHRVGGSYAAEDVLPRMAGILADAVGASRAIVWLRVGSELRPVGRAPTDQGTPPPLRIWGDELPQIVADSVIEVRDRGELLGALTVSMPANDPINPSKERLVRDLASQAGLVLRNVRLIEELRASRQRLVSAQDQERRRLERDIHDGAQQQLVALSVKLRLATGLLERDPAKARTLMEELQGQTTETLEDLRDLARGIYPPLLADKGLPAALEAQARKSPVPVTVQPDGVGRYGQDVESAVYFCCLEALNNVAKYADASSVEIRLRQGDGELRFEVADDGVGFESDATTHGTGLQGIADRLDALGGRLEIRTAPGEGTTLVGLVPAPTGETG